MGLFFLLGCHVKFDRNVIIGFALRTLDGAPAPVIPDHYVCSELALPVGVFLYELAAAFAATSQRTLFLFRHLGHPRWGLSE